MPRTTTSNILVAAGIVASLAGARLLRRRNFDLRGRTVFITGGSRGLGLVTTVCPGLMRTGSPRNALFKGDNRAEYAWFSVADSLPVLSINTKRAARQI